MEVVAGMYVRQNQDGMVACRKIPDTLLVRSDDSLSHRLQGAQFCVGLSRNWSVFRGRP